MGHPVLSLVCPRAAAGQPCIPTSSGPETLSMVLKFVALSSHPYLCWGEVWSRACLSGPSKRDLFKLAELCTLKGNVSLSDPHFPKGLRPSWQLWPLALEAEATHVAVLLQAGCGSSQDLHCPWGPAWPIRVRNTPGFRKGVEASPSPASTLTQF